ncbi:hypothetical protein O6H91_Y270300 [Diphasiastrum complanatum]|nr:hypothetical protein O6H91_Y270300 [Diphasiastrum complanatum]
MDYEDPDGDHPLLSSFTKRAVLLFEDTCTRAFHFHNKVGQSAAGLLLLLGIKKNKNKGKEEEGDVRLSSWQLAQGDTLAILIALRPPRNLLHAFTLAIGQRLWKESLVRVSVDGSVVPTYSILGNQNFWRTLVPTTPLDSPGPRSLVVNIKDGRPKPFVGTVDLCNKDYGIESIWLSDVKSTISGTPKEMKAVEAMLASETSQQYWHGPFIQPTAGEITTGYGLQRYYNGVYAKGYYHCGVDYGAEEGTNVQAPANGRVILVGQEKDGFKLHGNCVGIDHGQGITSILMHLRSTLVEEGRYVKAGEVVGTVGATGLATGPHLHCVLPVLGSK